jgi:hypothetical protein
MLPLLPTNATAAVVAVVTTVAQAWRSGLPQCGLKQSGAATGGGLQAHHLTAGRPLPSPSHPIHTTL